MKKKVYRVFTVAQSKKTNPNMKPDYGKTKDTCSLSRK